MKKSEVDAVIRLKLQGLKFPEIARRLKLSVHQVKRRWYENQPSDTPVAINHPELIGNNPKILFYDIENSPTLGYVWESYEANLLWTEHDWFLLSFAYKWAHEDEIKVCALPDYATYKKNKKDDKELCRELWNVIDEADIIVAHNGDQFDIKKAYARFITHGFNPPSTFKTIDTLKVARRHFKFMSNRLNELGNHLDLGEKIPHTGKDLWKRCIEGDPEAWEMMKLYNIQDVRLLEKVYYRVRPWITNHPNLNIWTETSEACPKCQSTHIQKRGTEVKLTTKRQRFQCQDCGGWFSGGPPIKKSDPLLDRPLF